jgi:hypothetical protein
MFVSNWIVACSPALPIISVISHSLPTACPIKGYQKCPINIFTLKMATAIFAERLDNFEYSTWLIPKILSFTLNSSRENLRTRTSSLVSVISKAITETFSILQKNVLRKHKHK